MEKFETLYLKLNSAQKEAVDAIEGPVMVIAGPGTGKTSILTLRIANILKKTDTRPEQILALTFTESGVQSMRAKLIEIMGAEAYKVNIHTFHGFANVQIKRFGDVFPRIIASENISEIQKAALVEEIIDTHSFKILRPYGDPHYYVSSIISSIQHLKRENMTVDDFTKYIEKREAEFNSSDDLYYESGVHQGKMKGKYASVQKQIEKNKELLVAYEEYENALVKQKLYDYEDMLLELIKAMREKNDFLLMLQEEYQYFLADEHQDANNAQNAILELLASFHESPNLFVVGDEKQAIFRFQGASLQNFLYFKEKYSNVELINLVENYRSTQTILDASHSLISHSEGEKIGRVELQANVPHAAHPIIVAEFSTEEIERKWIAKEVRKLIESGVSPCQVAVLFRKNREADALASAFNSEGIAYALFTDQDILEDHEVRKLILILEAINDPLQEGYVGEIMFFDLFDLPLVEVHDSFRKSRTERKPLLEILRTHALADSKMKEFHYLLLSLASSAKNTDLITFFESLLSKTGYSTYLVVGTDGRAHHPLRNLASFEVFLNEVKRFAQNNRGARLSDFLEYLRRLEKYHIRVKSSIFSKDQDKVVLMTAHKSKGLEFEYVFVTGVTEAMWGNTRDNKKFDLPFASSSHIDDDRRLFYVALTRAKKKAIISYGTSESDGRTLLPSQFILTIDPTLVEKPDFSKAEEEIRKQSAMPDFVSPKESILDKEYLRKIFLSEHFSVTSLNNFLSCPIKYFFNNLIRIPQLQTKHQMYGTAIHDTLRIFQGRLTALDDHVTKEDLLTLFEKEIRSKPLSKIDFEESMNKGRKSLSGYFDTYKNSWKTNVFSEYAVTGIEIPILGTEHVVTLRGIIDKIELGKVDRHVKQTVHVVDYKTSKPKSRNEIEGNTKNANGDYKRQLLFYKLLLNGNKKEDALYFMKTGEIDFIEPDEKGNYLKELFDIEDEEVRELRTCIEDTLKEIYTFDFFDKGCLKGDCESCHLLKRVRISSINS